MKHKLLLLLAFMFLLTSVNAADQSNQYVKQYMNPLYRQSMNQDTNYTYILEVDTPDGITNVINAMLTMQVWHNPTVNYYVWVDGQVCNTPTFQVHTSYANAGEGTIYFDCSNVITEEGTYTVTFMTDDDVGSSTFWAELTYSNSPRPKLTFGGTDYFSTEPSQLIFVQLIENLENGLPIDDAVCFAEVYARDATTHIFEDAPMVHTEHGLYHLHTNIIEPGVHIVSVECYYDYNAAINNFTSTDTTYGNYERLPGFLDFNFWEKDGGSTTNITSDVTSFGSEVEVRHDWDNKYGYLTTTSDFNNGDTVNMYARNINKLGDTIYLHDISGTTIYGSYIIDTVSVFEWNNVTLSNTGTGVTEIYISDLEQGGAHDIRWEFISILDPTGGGWFGDPDINNSITALQKEDGIYWKAVEDSNDRLEIEYTATGITGFVNESANLFWNGIWSEQTENLNISVWNYDTSSWDLLPNQITYSTINIDINNQINNITKYLSSGTFKAKIEHTLVNTDYGNMEIDRFVLETYESGGVYVQDVKGGGEVHIINYTLAAQDVWNAPVRSLTEFNFDTTDEEAIWEYEGNVSNNLLSQFSTAFWNYTGTISTSILAQISASVWQYIGTISTTITDTFSEQTWNYTNRTLTDQVEINATEISDEVWNNEGRYTHGILLS